jgi:hypothetical protein
LFHVQHEVVKATSASLASKKRQAEKKVEQASQLVTKHQKSDALLAPLLVAESPLQMLPKTELRTIEYAAKECVNLFQRSSSCVEGRNGQLALRHHNLHRLNERTLGALTTIHNFYLKRNDGTTAAGLGLLHWTAVHKTLLKKGHHELKTRFL